MRRQLQSPRVAQGQQELTSIAYSQAAGKLRGQAMKAIQTQNLITAALVGVLALSGGASAQEGTTTDAGTVDKATAGEAFKKPPYSPYAGRTFPTRPFFGDTHLHTSLSFDAGAAGCRLGPKEAYRFAKGEEV